MQLASAFLISLVLSLLSKPLQTCSIRRFEPIKMVCGVSLKLYLT